MTTHAAGNKDREVSSAPGEPAHPAARAAIMLRRRNRLFAIMFACVAIAVFVVVMTLAVLYHYAEVHHVVG